MLILSSRVRNDLDLTSANLAEGKGGTLKVRSTEIKDSFKFKDVRISPSTVVDLTDTSCAVLSDDTKSWPTKGQLVIDGLAYRSLANPGSASTRLEWLRRQLPAETADRRGQFRPQPYRQLAGVLRAQGFDGDATKILIGMAVDGRKWGGLRWWSRFAQWLLG